jgi:hypothetical protein
MEALINEGNGYLHDKVYQVVEQRAILGLTSIPTMQTSTLVHPAGFTPLVSKA